MGADLEGRMPKALLNNRTRLEWSYSRSALFRSCPRAFFFDRVGPVDQGVGRRALPLRALLGRAVHQAIAAEITVWASAGRVSLVRAQENALRRLDEAWSQRENRVIEVINGTQLPPTLYERLAKSARSRLRTFFRMLWPHFSKQTYVMHERLDSFDLGSIRVLVQADLVTRTERGEFVISDWKTGTTLEPEMEEIQMGIYALWANVGVGEDPDKILTQIVNLRTGQMARRVADPDLLLRVRTLINTEARLAVPPLRKARFKPKPTLEKCMACLFLRICPDGEREVAAGRGFWPPLA